MIIDKILDVVFGIINTIISLLPNYTPSHTDSFVQFLNAIASINAFFPVVELAEAIGAYLGFMVIAATVRPILKLAHLT